MNPTGSILAYADQETAERKLSELRGLYIDLVDKIRDAAEKMDSINLYRLAQAEEARINDINF